MAPRRRSLAAAALAAAVVYSAVATLLITWRLLLPSVGRGAALPNPLPFGGTFPCHDFGEAYGAAWLVHKSILTSFRGNGGGGGGGVGTAASFVHPGVRFDYDAVAKPGWSPGRNVTYGGERMAMEAASFEMFRHVMEEASSMGSEGWGSFFLRQRRRGGGVRRTVDALEFAVEHWSSYEKNLGVRGLRGEGLRRRAVEAAIRAATRREQSLAEEAAAAAAIRAQTYSEGGADADTFKLLGEMVVAVMPYHASDQGHGYSNADARRAYLNLTYHSVVRYFPHVAVVVSNDVDYEYCAQKSGLDFAEVIRIDDGLPSSGYLPLATMMEMHRRFREGGEWSTSMFEYAYFTEADQVLHLRPHQLVSLLEEVSSGRRGAAALVPHRFMVMPRPSEDLDESFVRELQSNLQLTQKLKDIDNLHMVEAPDDGTYRCCLVDARTNPCSHRKDWVPLFGGSGGDDQKGKSVGRALPDAHLFRYGESSAAMVNGQGNEFKMTFRTCRLQRGGTCPGGGFG